MPTCKNSRDSVEIAFGVFGIVPSKIHDPTYFFSCKPRDDGNARLGPPFPFDFEICNRDFYIYCFKYFCELGERYSVPK